MRGWLRRGRREGETGDIVSRAEGADRDVSVALIDVPVLRAESGRLRLQDDDATVAMLDAVDEWLPRAVAPESRRRPWHCPVCVLAQSLDADQTRQESHRLPVRAHQGSPFVMEVTIPSVSCPGCGRLLALYDEERDDALKEAIMAALDTGGINRK